MIYDAHIHFIPKEISDQTSFYKGVWADKSKLFSYLEQNDIEKALLTYPSTDAHLQLEQKKVCQIYNKAQEELIKENPKIVAVGLLNLESIEQISEQVKNLSERGFRALNLSSSYQGRFLVEELTPLFKAAQEFRLPIFIHPQTINPIGFERVDDPLLMPVLEYSFDSSMFMGLLMTKGILQKFEVDFIFSSLGGIMPFLKNRFDRVYTMLRKREIVKDLGDLPSEILKKVYVDTSGASLENIKMALDFFGPDHILWGSDYPVNPPVAKNLEKLDKLGELKNKIVYQNFKQLFRL
ncbi:MAG: amidohydrolase [Candidatus Omnitrophica bacterium]|nr:amidohydrolase [Candidatus Omnitrophota bacterium]MCF7895245.1 amidohydrolase [Candidatus Omnitrophota bacterium]